MKFPLVNFEQDSSQEYQSADSETETDSSENQENNFADSVKDKNEDYSAKAQEVRALMRERFLRAVTNFSGRKCEARVFGVSTTVTAEFGAMNAPCTYVCVKNLKTPTDSIKLATLQTDQIMWLNISGKNSDLHSESKDRPT